MSSPEERIKELARKNAIGADEAARLLASVKPPPPVAAGGRFDPFTRYPSGALAAAGLVATVLAALLCRLGVRFPGALDVMATGTAGDLRAALFDQLAAFPLTPPSSGSPSASSRAAFASSTSSPPSDSRVVASPPDMARFVELLGTGKLLSAEMQAELVKPVATPQPGLSYGLGVFMSAAEFTGGMGPAIGHGGDIMGYHAWGMYFPERKTTVFGTVMSDRGNGNSILVAGITALAAH